MIIDTFWVSQKETLYVLSTLVINTASEGPYLIVFLEIPAIIQQILQYVRELKLGILESLTLQKIIVILNNPEKTTNRLKQLPYFWALLDPVFGP